MGARPDLANVGDMAEPIDAEGRGEFAQLLRRERARIFPVGIAGKEQLELGPAGGGRAKASIRVSTPLSTSMRPT